MSQKSILGVDFLQVSAGYNYKTHVGTKICDIVDKSFTKFAFRAPFDCEIVSIDGAHENTIVFQSKENVLIPARSAAVPICFRCSHMECSEYSSIITGVGQSFDQGEICYYAGGRSGTTDGHFTNHIHLEFAIGTFTGFEQLASGEGFVIKQMTVNTTDSNPHICFNEAAFIKPGTVVNINGGDTEKTDLVNSFILTLTNGGSDTLLNFYYKTTGAPENNNYSQSSGESLYMKLTGSAAAIREYAVSGTPLVTVAINGKLYIDKIYHNTNSDGYRWMKTHSGITTGYSQYDRQVMHPIGSATNTMNLVISTNTPLKSYVGSNNDILTLIPGELCQIIDFLPNTYTDGYRWMKIKKGLNYGYIPYISSSMVVYSDTGSAPIPPVVTTGYYLNTTNQSVTIRTSVVNGQIVTTVPVGNSLEIIEFLGIQSDNYQWAKTKYGTNIGYSQIDTHGAYTISGSGQTIYLKTTRASVRLRAGYAGSSTYRIVPQGSQLKIIRFETGFKSDGYQWVYGYYDGANGYAQLDTYNAYTIGF